MSITNYDLVIFDCDGTLVDSETLNNTCCCEVIGRHGLSGYTPELCIESFAGKSWDKIKLFLEEKHNVVLPQAIITDYIELVQSKLGQADIAIEGAKDFVDHCAGRAKVCVGSNGERSNVIKGLALQGFEGHFKQGNIYTKDQVENPKPAPDLFLYAAEQMGADPSRCLVIEDSVSGAQAGLNAGMDVFGFTGVAHDKKTAESALKNIGITEIFEDFIHMRDALNY